MLSNDRRSEIATFLRIRRARLQPEQIGLPRGTRRRTPGLRREEVAELAGISTEWYAWLEQMRDVHPSMDTLQRIARALRLEPAEQQHLLTLGGYGPENGSNGSAREAVVSPQLQRLMNQLEFCPAWITGARSDILAWNRAATAIHGDLDAMRGIERNGVHQLFLNPRIRRMLVNWELHARDCVAKLRLTYANYIDDPWFNVLIGLLLEQSPEFAEWWEEHNVQLPQDGVKAYEHPEAGRLTFDYAVLQVAGGNGLPVQLITYIPKSDTPTQAKMEVLMGNAGYPGEDVVQESGEASG
ncbi:helix-turn-helix transcriptional regulator [Aidingimonas halophila]|uniref:Helix-turn-helix domain-containing protein n=1 Tax=Aidingimonas halophila TaxID=574349 RepID=A0A1H2UXK8_9GAMM|nr:helix-turn-helix transcriptional regulator [Aidingimonas halophila]GHC23355.1 transcriptional regulator [Aidingimonas halophila]SDW60812.1 Helix-turn-helix domain-containing protein [Aidingimonas halophila]